MPSSASDRLRTFRRWGTATLVAVYLLILAGGIVRSTGSGMGCPDWPKCFGSWVPPTEASQLPANYRNTYAQKRQQKNERLAGYLDKLGFSALSQRVHNESIIYTEADFNATKTWIEYVNRLLGAVIGLLVFGTLIAAARVRRVNRSLFYLSLLTFIAVGFQGWIGSIVVSTNLLPGMVTVHMLLAILIVLLLIYAVYRSYGDAPGEVIPNARRIQGWLIAALVLTTVQIGMGTQVREAIDAIAATMNGTGRSEWVERIGADFYLHRSFSLLVLGVHAVALYYLRKSVSPAAPLFRVGVFLLLTIVLEIMAGISLAYLDLPAVAQPVHLLLAIVAVGIQFTAVLLLNQHRRASAPATSHLDKTLSYQ